MEIPVRNKDRWSKHLSDASLLCSQELVEKALAEANPAGRQRALNALLNSTSTDVRRISNDRFGSRQAIVNTPQKITLLASSMDEAVPFAASLYSMPEELLPCFASESRTTVATQIASNVEVPFVFAKKRMMRSARAAQDFLYSAESDNDPNVRVFEALMAPLHPEVLERIAPGEKDKVGAKWPMETFTTTWKFPFIKSLSTEKMEALEAKLEAYKEIHGEARKKLFENGALLFQTTGRLITQNSNGVKTLKGILPNVRATRPVVTKVKQAEGDKADTPIFTQACRIRPQTSLVSQDQSTFILTSIERRNFDGSHIKNKEKGAIFVLETHLDMSVFLLMGQSLVKSGGAPPGLSVLLNEIARGSKGFTYLHSTNKAFDDEIEEEAMQESESDSIQIL